ncbi:vasculin-like isoform X2 [Lytechinus variegatus]|uniref:vasculin-like isoform X2 n=1 Tax=Lytechinus variegatus TaxID=7654 RepID=UPI001BB26D5C|nr:vasculin-like isoform X2 [Lytechinus variegatus]
MPVATMANPPEHDFAPSWLKIPNDNQLIAKPHSDQRAGSKYPSHHHSDVGRQRSRHPSNESFPGFPPRHPPQPPNIHGYRSRDEKRYRPGPRYHSLDDPLRHSELPSAYAPLNQHNGFLPPPPAMGYFPSSLDYGFHPKRGGPLPLHHNLNRLDPHGYHHGGRGYGGGDGGRGRYSGGGGGGRHGRGGGVNNKAGPENGESNSVENGGGGGGAGSGAGGGSGGGRKSDAASVKGDEGKTNGDKSALSSHDFPSLSGDADHDVKNESSKPAGAWEKRPGTSNISIGGKKLQLVQKSSTVSDLPTTNGSQPAASKMSPSGVNGVSNLTSGSKTSGVQQAVQNKGAKTGRGAVPLSSVSSSVYKSLVPKSSAPTKATTPRKAIAKEVVIRPAPVISNKDKSALPPTSSSSSSPSPSSSMSSSSSSSSSTSSSTSLPSPSSNAVSSQPSSNPLVKEGSPRSTSAIDIPTPRMVTGSKVKRTDKVDFLKELRRTGSVDSPRLPLSSEPLVNGTDHYTSNHNDQSSQYHNYHKSSTKQYEKTNSTTIYQQPDPFEDLDIAEARQDSIINTHLPITKCNGHFDNEGENADVDDNIDQVTENGEMDMALDEQSLLDCQPMELSSSLEAEKRLLQEMGWHEHSDNEEGYAPITEDERNEFRIRSEQMGKNGISRPTQPIILNLVPHPVMNAITTMTIEDAELSSSSDESSDDEL